MKRVLSPLRYPGGKGKLHRLIRLVLRQNCLEGSTYIEPCAGGAGLALTLLVDEYVDKIWINDYDISIYAFWHSIMYETERFCQLINDTDILVQNWSKFREYQKHKSEYSLLELGFSTFYLNRINRSGIIMGGIIGGTGQTGPSKIDARFNKKNLISRIQKIASYGNRVTVTNHDAKDLLLDHIPKTSNPFIYLDPPYYRKAEQLYVNHFLHEDHQSLCEVVTNLQCPWLVSYDNVPEINLMYGRFNKKEFSISYSAGTRCLAKEVMFISPSLNVPEDFDLHILSKEGQKARNAYLSGLEIV